MFPPAPSHVAPTPCDTRLPAPETRVNNAVGEGMRVGRLAGRREVRPQIRRQWKVRQVKRAPCPGRGWTRLRLALA